MGSPGDSRGPSGGPGLEQIELEEDPAGRLVLLVEDDASVLEALAFSLRLEGFRILTARSGTEALELARAQRPVAVVTDLVMPGLPALELIAELRSDSDLGGPPVLVLSGRVQAAERRQALEAGAARFLPKPCRLRVLVEALEEVLA